MTMEMEPLWAWDVHGMKKSDHAAYAFRGANIPQLQAPESRLLQDAMM